MRPAHLKVTHPKLSEKEYAKSFLKVFAMHSLTSPCQSSEMNSEIAHRCGPRIRVPNKMAQKIVKCYITKWGILYHYVGAIS
jgi:hypothetical protein